MSRDKKLTYKEYLEMSLFSMSIKLCMIAVKQPFQLLQYKKQTTPEISIIDIIKNIYKTKGLQGFYQSTLITISKIICTEAYRLPLIVGTPEYIKNNLPKEFCNTFIVSSSSAITIATVDSAFICPFLKIITHQISDNNYKITNSEIIKSYLKDKPFRKFYHGYPALWLQSITSWGSFYLIDDYSKVFIKKHFNEVSYSSLVIPAIFGATTQALVCVVPEAIRVKTQSNNDHNVKSINIFKDLVKSKNIFKGLPLTIINNFVGFILSSASRKYFIDENYVSSKNIKENEKFSVSHNHDKPEQNYWQGLIKENKRSNPFLGH